MKRLKLQLSSNQLKIIALILMTCDHVGLILLDDMMLMRILGRLSMPIFAYAIAEGCRYTKNKKRYLLLILIEGLICQGVFYFVSNSLYMNILLTFSVSIMLIYTIQYFAKNKSKISIILLISAFLISIFLVGILPKIVQGTDYDFDYGIFGVMLPVCIYLGNTKAEKLAFAAVAMILFSLCSISIQWFSLLSLVLLALHSGKRGKMKMKYLFYIYYPLHLVLIYLIAILV